MFEATCFCDGGSRGNGQENSRAAIGYVIYDNVNKKEYRYHKFLGTGLTNNYAEYTAVIECLKKMIKMNIKSFELNADSQLLINQLNGKYAVRSENIIPLYRTIKNELLPHFDNYKFNHVLRYKNKVADSLVNYALDNSE